MPKVSVIVPVYKVEQYIEECIESIIAQSYGDWELLLVDDGSPDNSGAICDEYAKKDNRIKVYHKPNGGVSSARNFALKNAVGRWITFVDSDDCLYPSALEKLITVAELNEVDLVQCSFNRQYTAVHQSSKEFECYTITEYVNSKLLGTHVWGSLFRNDIIISNQLCFRENLKLGEDQIFVFDFLKSSKIVCRLWDELYYYRDNENSATNNNHIDDMIYSINAFISYKQENKLSVLYMDNIILNFIYEMVVSSSVAIKTLILLFEKARIKFYEFNTRGAILMYKMSWISPAFVFKLFRFLK